SISLSVTPDLWQKRGAGRQGRHTEEVGHGLADIGEGGPPTQIDRTHVGAKDEERHYLTRVIGRRCGRIVAVIGGKDNEVLFAHSREETGKAAVKCLKALAESPHVVAVSPG